MHRSNLLALGAILLWSSLAMLGTRLAHLPPFWLTGVALLMGSVLALPLCRLDFSQWRVPGRTLALGVYGLFGFHFLLFTALRHAPPVQANLINYLWPLGMVVLAPVLLPGMRLSWRQALAACIGFAGAALAITGGTTSDGAHGYGMAWGYLAAFASAFIWASYSLLTQKASPFPTSVMGLFALVSGGLSLICHAWLEPAAQVRAGDWLALALMGLGPLGAAFYLWDAALKAGNPQQIGLLSFLTPLLSTLLLLWDRGQTTSASVAGAAVLIVGAAWLGRAR